MNNQTNTLLVKADVGKQKPLTYKLPNSDHAYGKEYQKDKEGAKEVSMSWLVHQKTDPPAPKTDFKKLNKVVVKEGLSKAKDYGDYKKNHQVVQNQRNRTNPKKENRTPIDENFIFGKKERVSTPIGQVLCNQYALESEKILADNYKRQEEEKKRKNAGDVKIKSQTLAVKSKEKIDGKQKDGEKKQPFVLKKFQNIPSKIDNNKKAALKNKEEEIIENYFEQNNAN